MGLKQLVPWAGNVISKLSNSYNNMFLGFMKRSDISIDMAHMPTSTFPKLYNARFMTEDKYLKPLQYKVLFKKFENSLRQTFELFSL